MTIWEAFQDLHSEKNPLFWTRERVDIYLRHNTPALDSHQSPQTYIMRALLRAEMEDLATTILRKAGYLS